MIKKFLYGFAIIAGLASCNDDYTDWATPQTNAPDEAISVTVSVAPAAAIEFASVTSETVQLFTPTVTGDVVGTTIYTVLLYNADRSANVELTTTDGKVSTEELENYIDQLYGRRPVPREVALDITAITTIDEVSYVHEATTTVTVTPEAPLIESAYYMVGDMFGWEEADMVKFNHSGKDVYDDPIFTIMFTTSKDNCYWKIIPQSNVDAGNILADGVVGVATDGDPALEGTLVNVAAQAGKIEKAAMYSMTLNMMDYSYTIKEIAPEYYIVGAVQNWNADPATGKTCVLYPQTAMVHSYTTQFNDAGNLKIWLGSDFSDWNNCFGAMTDGDNSATGTLVGTGAGAIVCPEPGAFYTITVDFSSMAYTWTKLENQTPKEFATVGLIGGFCGWGTDSDMTEVTPHNWYYSGFTLTEASEVKFRANDDWADSWGKKVSIADEAYGVAEYNGNNFTVPAGTYNVFFNDITGEYVFVTVK